jgi:soluble lytic murein transglycosylase-like protein
MMSHLNLSHLNPCRLNQRLLAPLLGVLLLSLALFPVAAYAGETTETSGASTPAPTSTSEASQSTGPSSASPPNTPTVSSEATSTEPSSESAAPQVKAQRQQAPSAAPRRHAKANQHSSASAEGEAGGGSSAPKEAGARTSAPGASKNVHAPAPSALTPPPPSALGSALGGVPDFFIANFPLPPFLLPIYQAAGKAYGIPWQVLAAINEVETDYGRDLSISSAGAEGWMQFLPSTWALYGVDANGDGFADPYNPADAIFAAARYLKAAGGGRHIREAIFAYNHSQSYVASVLLRAQLLQGTPPQLLSAIADLAEARFPVHAPAQFSDGFPTVPAHPGRPLVATTINSTPGAPVIAVQDGTITAIGRSAALGRYVKLSDAYGDIYTYGELGSVATLYPVLTPHAAAVRRGHIAEAGVGVKPGHGGVLPPASAGVQPRSPVTAGAVSSGLALGAAAALEATPAPAIPTPLLRSRSHRPHTPLGSPRVFRTPYEDVSLHPLQVGSQVIAGTVIGHLGSAGVGSTGSVGGGTSGSVGEGTSGTSATQASMVFQIRPAGVGAPLIDPKPILDGWVRLEGSLVYRATGRHRFPSAPSALHGSSVLHGSGPAPQGAARLADVLTRTLTPGQWLQLTAHLGTIPDPVVAAGHSPASIPTAKGNGNGNH